MWQTYDSRSGCGICLWTSLYSLFLAAEPHYTHQYITFLLRCSGVVYCGHFSSSAQWRFSLRSHLLAVLKMFAPFHFFHYIFAIVLHTMCILDRHAHPAHKHSVTSYTRSDRFAVNCWRLCTFQRSNPKWKCESKTVKRIQNFWQSHDQISFQAPVLECNTVAIFAWTACRVCRIISTINFMEVEYSLSIQKPLHSSVPAFNNCHESPLLNAYCQNRTMLHIFQVTKLKESHSVSWSQSVRWVYHILYHIT